MIVLNLGLVAKVRSRDFIIRPLDECTASEFFQFMCYEYIAKNALAIRNIRNQIDSTKYIDAKSSDSQIDKFKGRFEKLENEGVNLKDENKIPSIIRSLPKSFAPITITLSTVAVEFNLFLNHNKI